MNLVSENEHNFSLKTKIFQTNFDIIDSSDLILLLNEIEESKLINFFNYLEERYLLDIFSKLFSIFSGKDKRNYILCYTVGIDIISKINEWGCVNYVNIVKDILKKSDSTKNEREYAYKFLINLIENHSQQISICMSELIPIVTNDNNSPIKEVKENSLKCLKLLLNCSGNDDLKPFIPIVVKAIVDKSKIPEAVEQLAGCIFVQNVEDSALSVTIPILIKGLVDRQTETKRKCCVIINNMCELVEHPKEVISFSVRIQSLLENCSENISDPEARNVANKALNTLKSSLGSFSKDILLKKNKDDVLKYFSTENDIDKNLIYLCNLLSNLCNKTNFNKDLWKNIFDSYCPPIYFNEEIFDKIFNNLKCSFEIKEELYEDNEEGENLYKGSFSLAYGALTLLNNAHLHLKRNRFYGLLGPNNCGKTTLMRAISNEQVEGFPKRDQLKTVFVEHEIHEREVGEDDKGFPILNIDLSGVEWVVDCCNNVYNLENKVTIDEVEKVMENIGFGNSKRDKGHDRAADAWMGVTTYSGGWKMKMQLCAATLMNADILMLDEPTGHLDVTNIAWIKSWLNEFINKGGSIITTSHDSSFLNEMCTHLIDFQNRKLKTFKGDYGSVLKEFVEKFPEKKGYFELKNDVMKFTFPDPSQLEGVKSMSKSILKMKDITFTYPTRDKPTITNVSLECSRVSRVAVIGANGAGKSTAIKILIGELKPEIGEIWKHPNVRLAYIAQHAFHHLEKHIHKTPTQYILWRFAGNEDKENVDLINNRVEESEVKKKYMIDPSTMTDLRECFGDEEEKKCVEVEKILKRRDNKKEKTKEYEVKLKGKSEDSSLWVVREILLNMGCLSLVQRHDEKEAVAAGLMSKPLTSASIEKHLKGFGIEAEHASHTLIKSLSGGQKVKVVLAASLWQNPHLVILDEPTNYLDRDGLGALTKAIEEFKGGVIIISHNREFANAVSQEKWIMEKGKLRKEGESYGTGKEEDSGNSEIQGDEIVKDSFGNEIKVDKKQNLSEKEKKKEIKNLQKKIKDGRKKGTLSEEQILDLEDKIDELQK